MIHKILNSHILVLCGTALAVLTIWTPAPLVVKLVSATLLLFFLPGWLLLQVTRVENLFWLERLSIGVGLSFGLTTVGALLVVYFTGGLSLSSVLSLTVLLILALVATNAIRPAAVVSTTPKLSSVSVFYFALMVGIATFFSLTNLGYADYWGDEMNGLLRALGIMGGDWQIVLRHTKGPAEILIPATFGLFVGQFEPTIVRFPFAIAHIFGLGGFFLLGQRMFGRTVGMTAALVLSINGLYIAFGRIVQYQAIVFLMTSLTLLLAFQFYRRNDAKTLTLIAFLAATGLLAHYDMLLALPAAAYLIWQHYRQNNWLVDIRGTVFLVAAGMVFILVVAIFYVPFVLNPNVTNTESYLSRIIGVSNWPANNFDQLYTFGVLYNSRFYMATIALLGVGKIIADVFCLFSTKQNKSFWFVTFTILGLCLVATVLGYLAAIPLLLFSLLLLWLLLFSTGSPELKTVYVWFGVSFIGYVFFVDHPRTHLQIIFPGWSLLVAVALGQAGRVVGDLLKSPVTSRLVSRSLITALLILFLFFAYYEYLLFVDAKNEYILTYPTHKTALYWEDDNFPFGSRRLYGAPHRLGWQMVLQLMVQGEIKGDWHSNDDGTNLFWYTVGHKRNPCYPRYFFHSEFEQKLAEEIPSSLQDPLNHGYVSVGKIYNRDRLQAEIFQFSPLGETKQPAVWQEPQYYATPLSLGDFVSRPYEVPPVAVTNRVIPGQLFSPASEALQQISDAYGDPRITQVKDQVELVGYDLDTTWAVPGGVLLLTLHWQAAEVINLPYKVFVHLQDETGQLVAQSDDYPNCGTRPTNRWKVGEPVTDRHLLRLPDDLPPGQYALKIGLYEPQTGLRLDLLDELGNPQGVSLPLSAVSLPVDQN